jgi:hypothetical protein
MLESILLRKGVREIHANDKLGVIFFELSAVKAVSVNV